MDRCVIEASELGKRYRIRHGRFRQDGLRHVMTDWLTRPFRRGGTTEDLWAIRDVSFEVQAGEVLGIIGRNGSGKTTLLKVLSRITPPTEGQVRLSGRVGSLLEVGTGFHPDLTGRENVYLNGSILGMRRREIDANFDEIVAFAEVDRFLDTPVKRYSSGMYVRLAFAIAAHLQPEILLIDEVLAVGDVRFQKKCLGKMRDVARGGRTVLFVSHNMASVKSLCDRAILLSAGRIERQGDVDETVDAYLETMGEQARTPAAGLPVFNEAEGIGITDIQAEVLPDEDGRACLTVDIGLRSRRALKNIGVGVSLTSTRGVPVAVLGPSVTNYVIDEIDGPVRCSFRCPQIDRYLAGGEYVLGLWLSRPRTEYLLKLDCAAVLQIPSRDLFASGVSLEERHHGIVPLPIEFSVEGR